MEALLESANSAKQRAEQARLAECPVNAESPLVVYLERDLLRAVVETSVRQLTAALRRKSLDPAIREELTYLRDVRRTFSKWLKASEDPQVYVSLHPAPTFDEVVSS